LIEKLLLKISMKGLRGEAVTVSDQKEKCQAKNHIVDLTG
jgi:hypothetical protein